jgi:outer membrane protein assembly factor BamA
VVDFEVTKSHQQDFDLKVARFLYNSAQGWTGEGSAATTLKGNTFQFGLLSDGDSLIERVAGIRAKFERKSLGTNRLSFRFEFDSYHDQWNQATLAYASASDIYQSRQVFTPEATVVIVQPLEWSFGVSFARLRVPDPAQTEGGGAAAAKTESSNAVVNTLRYHQRWGSAKDPKQQELTGSYSVSTATELLGTDRDFTRHKAEAHYKYRHGRTRADVAFLAGRVTGNAPLYERFVLGDSTTLRGYSKFDLDPLGGSRLMHGSVDYLYRFVQAFYDVGAIWDSPRERDPKQSVGVGFKKEYFQLAVAFPLREGRVDPIFYAGMNF